MLTDMCEASIASTSAPNALPNGLSVAAVASAGQALHDDLNRLLQEHNAQLVHRINERLTSHARETEILRSTSMSVGTQTLHSGKEPSSNQIDESFLETNEPHQNNMDKTAISHFAMAKGWTTQSERRKTTSHAPGQALFLARRQQDIAHMPMLQRIIKSSAYRHFNAAIILINCAVLGIEVENLSRTGIVNPWLDLTNKVFVCLFTLDIVIRVWFERLSFLTSAHSRAWNIVDAIVVILALIELMVHLYLGSDGGSRTTGRATIFRMVKVLRIARTLRAVKALSVLQDLRLMIESIMHSTRLFVWAFLLTLLLIYIFAIIFAVAICQQALTTDDDMPEVIIPGRGSVLLQVMTILFETLFGGTSWSEFSRPLARISKGYEFLFMAFVMLSHLVLLNVVTGVVVQGSLTAASQDRDLVIHEQFTRDGSYVRELSRLFEEADLDNGGKLTLDELECFLQDPQVIAFLKGLDVNVGEALGLFNLLDSNNDGAVDAEEFTLGCMRLKGPAKHVDIATLLFENKKLIATMTTKFTDVMNAISFMCTTISTNPVTDLQQSNDASNFVERPVCPPASAAQAETFSSKRSLRKPERVMENL